MQRLSSLHHERAGVRRHGPAVDLLRAGRVDQLDAIRDKYGVDLYRECYADALHEVTEAANITTHLRALGVECKPIFTPDDCHVNFIAVFSLGSTTAQRINEIARKADLCVLFQCPTH